MKELPDELRRQLGRAITRRTFLRRAKLSLGAIALGELIGSRKSALAAGPQQDVFSLDHPLAVRPPMFAPKAKAVIYVDMAGAPL